MFNFRELKPNPKNPRIITEKEFLNLKQKILRIPQGLEVQKILFKDGIIIAGNQRFRALLELADEGFEVKDSYFVDATDWTDDQLQEFLITSNISDGEWDWDVLANEWDIEQLGGWGLEKTQYLLKGINSSDENSEWVGMPEFESKDEAYKVIIQFDNETDREDYLNKSKLKISTKQNKTYSTWWPYKERSNLSDKIYE